MRRIAEEECEAWLRERGIPEPDGLEVPELWAKAAFQVPKESAGKAWFCIRTFRVFGESGDLLVWFRDWPFAQEHERAVLECVGCSAGRGTFLIDAPGFLFPAGSASVARGLFELGCLLGVDTLVSDAGGQSIVFVSHHDVGLILFRDRMQLGHITHELIEGGVRRVDT